MLDDKVVPNRTIADIPPESSDILLESVEISLESGDIPLESADIQFESTDIPPESNVPGIKNGIQAYLQVQLI